LLAAIKSPLTVDQFGFDAAINYKADDITAAAKVITSNSKDIYVDIDRP
jgi:NADPH-dependent curcumin reductase CurA